MEAEGSSPPAGQQRSEARLAWPAGVDPGAALAEANLPILLVCGPDRHVRFNHSCAELAHAHGVPIGAVTRALMEAGRASVEQAFLGNGSGCRAMALAVPHQRGRPALWFKLSSTPLRDDRGQVGAVLCIVIDVTTEVRLDQRVGQLEDEARARDTEYAIVYSNMEEVVYHLAVEAGRAFRFVSVNKAFFDATGLGPDDVIGKQVHEVIPEPSCSLVLQRYREAIAAAPPCNGRRKPTTRAAQGRLGVGDAGAGRVRQLHRPDRHGA